MRKFLLILLLCVGVFAKPNVYILATGGTIAGVAKSNTDKEYKAGTIGVEQLISAVPEIKNLANVKGEQFINIPSTNMNPEIWLNLAKKINTLLNRDDVDGIVVTHGTDTMEETAYFLNLTIKSKKPVVLVGAMRPATAMSADGVLNLYNAVGVASDKNSLGRGVMVVMNNEIHQARDVTKTNTSDVATFKSLNFGKIGSVNYAKVEFTSEFNKKHTINSDFDIMKLDKLPQVDIIYAYAGDSDKFIKTAIDSGSKGIILAGMGNGSPSQIVWDALANASKNAIAVVRSSRVGSGSTSQNSVIDDKKFNFITADNLNPQKARVLLMLALSKTQNIDEIQKIFDTH